MTPDSKALEAAAPLIYNLFAFAGTGEKPPWVPNGNSFKQDEARKLTQEILNLYHASLKAREMLKFVTSVSATAPAVSEKKAKYVIIRTEPS